MICEGPCSPNNLVTDTSEVAQSTLLHNKNHIFAVMGSNLWVKAWTTCAQFRAYPCSGRSSVLIRAVENLMWQCLPQRKDSSLHLPHSAVALQLAISSKALDWSTEWQRAGREPLYIPRRKRQSQTVLKFSKTCSADKDLCSKLRS